MRRRPRPLPRFRGRALAASTAGAVALVLSALSGAPAALAASTPAPTRPPTATPAPCPAGETRTPVVLTPPSPGGPLGPSSTVAPDGTVVTTYCATTAPTPQRGPVIAPEHTVGGPGLAGTGVLVDGRASVPAPPTVTDVSWVVADVDTGEVLAAKNPHALLLPASTLKTLTALVTLPALPPTRVVRASPQAVGAVGTRVGLVEGSPYTVDQLFQGLVLVSGNDTAYALADAYGGTARLLAAMNAKAAQLGAWDTLAKDPSGLDEVGQRSSAYDLALFGRAVMALPAYRKYATLRTATFPGGTDPRGKVYQPFTITNHNLLLENYPGTIGVKNGYTSGARHTFIGAATRGGRTLLVTEMGGGVVPSWQPSAQLLDWAFAHADDLTPVGTLVAAGAPQPPEWRSPAGSATPGSRTTPTSPTSPTSTTSTAPPTTISPPSSSPSLTSAPPVALAGTTGPGGQPRILTDPLTYAVLAALAVAGLALWVTATIRRRRRRGASTPG